jgi:hypothetical protein
MKNIFISLLSVLLVCFLVSILVVPVTYAMTTYTALSIAEVLLGFVAVGVLGILAGVINKW